jgi:hypothetical protein
LKMRHLISVSAWKCANPLIGYSRNCRLLIPVVLIRGPSCVGVVERYDAGALLSLASLPPRGHGVEKVEEVEVGADWCRWWSRSF